MRATDEKGFTLIELVLAITIMGIIAGATVTLISMHLKAHKIASDRSSMHHEGLLVMDRMTNGVRRSTYLLIPNNHNQTRDILAFSGLINDDNDYYFNDSLFPKYDEDLHTDANDDGEPGIASYDDDGDGGTDEGSFNSADDDEDGLTDEDPIDGIDNDGDGNIDEDAGWDFGNDGVAGIAGIDDDQDGTVDEGIFWDDDEDGSVAEVGHIPVIYTFNNGANTLTETIPFTSETTDLSTHVTNFEAKWESPTLIKITLELTDDDGNVVIFTEHAYVRNVLQKTGKRVR
jgi:prepilin-type N-terminal cleavage/methylation domain